jgi:hypothetical protein
MESLKMFGNRGHDSGQRRSKSPLIIHKEMKRYDLLGRHKWVVLDLDSTLIFSRPADMDSPLISDSRKFYVKPTAMETVLKVTKRKHVDEFLDSLASNNYKIIIWSAGIPSYVKAIVSVLFDGRDFEYVLTSDHLQEDKKKLRTISDIIPSFRPEDSRLIDDNIHHSEDQETFFFLVDRYTFSGYDPTEEEDDEHLKGLVEKINISFKK